jgi:hypothetical protein
MMVFVLFATAPTPTVGPTQLPNQLDTGPGRESDHSPPSSAQVKNEWSYTSTHQYVFMAWCLVKDRDNLTIRR